MSDPSSVPPATVVAVLGMHRSGTSWLAGSLQELGLPPGTVNESAIHNAKGDRESPRIRRIHDRVLEENGGSWPYPSSRNVWSDGPRNKLRRRIESMSARSRIWGFEDPRTVIVIDQWHRQVPGLKQSAARLAGLPGGTPRGFHDRDLVHSGGGSEPIPKAAADVWGELERCAED